ncbi:MAG: hypothetical protein JNM80_12770 [Phycisphaerae bacterium]|nr:hypothetical protein [Phycisphaerae bacterium]
MSLHSSINVVLGVLLTDRAAEFERMLASLAPVADDPHLHLVVLDNSDHSASEDSAVIATDGWPIAGIRSRTRSDSPRSPLHLARPQLAKAIARSCSILPAPVLIWSLDDDLTFEELDLVGGRPTLRNVARERITQVRRLFSENPEWDVLIGGFTGDPPVRPESIIAAQLSDARFNLERAMTMTPDVAWPWHDSPRRCVDDYYDLAERYPLEQVLCPLPWTPRAGTGSDFESIAAALLEAVAAIPQGRALFRPLLPLHSGPYRESQRPNCGGNAVFRRMVDLLSHPFPAMPVGNTYSRRSDMIGLNLLRHRVGLRVAEGPLTLYHDRAFQPRIGSAASVLLAEFVGVLVSRYVSSRTDQRPIYSLSDFALQRASRVQAALTHARDTAADISTLLHSVPSFWSRSTRIGASLNRAKAEMSGLAQALTTLMGSDEVSRMSEPTLHAEAFRYAESLMRDSQNTGLLTPLAPTGAQNNV